MRDKDRFEDFKYSFTIDLPVTIIKFTDLFTVAGALLWFFRSRPFFDKLNLMV